MGNIGRKALVAVVLLAASHLAFAQSEAQVKSELEKRGIDTLEEIRAELSKRGMTEDDARRQAKLYGLNYDDYVNKYIVSQKNPSENTPTSVENVAVKPVDFTTETTNDVATQQPVPEAKNETGLKYYGYDVFNDNPYANQQALIGNIDPGYLIGPGDELRVYLWGEAEFQFEGTVDINGNLFIPNVGQVFVSGTSYEGLNIRMKEYLSRFYSGLKKNPPKIFLDVSLTKLRPIRIMVMGESNNPGSHMINAFATTLNSLYASGGIKTSGSLREIKVFRNNKFISTIDLYDYLIKGAVSEDIRLISNDVIFIQSRLNSISLRGEVNREGIYELKANEGLMDLLGFSGGIKPTADESITIRRLKSIMGRTPDSAFDREIISVNYNELMAAGNNFRLQDGDEITFGRVLDKLDNVVKIAGSVFRPGEYQLEKGMTVRELIENSGGPRPNTFFDKLDLYRRDANGDLKFKSLSLANVLAADTNVDNISLQPDDSLKLYNEDELKTLEMVSIEGFLDEPKSVLWREEMSLYDLIFMSANVEDLEYQNRILTSRADLLRFQPGKSEYQVIPFNLDNVLNKRFNALLKPKDRVILYSRSISEELEKYVVVTGAVKNQGRYLLTDSMNVEDLIIQAGGFLRTSFRDSVTISRENFDFTGNRIAITSRIKTNMDYLLGLQPKAANSEFLKNNDQVTVDLIPGSSSPRKVKVSGEVKFPGDYFLQSKSETLTQLVDRAGGLSPNVYLPAARFYRNGQQLAFAFDKLFEENSSAFDITLSHADSIYFPESNFTIRVEGQVINPSLQKYISGQSVRSYVRNAGGKSRDGRKIIITQPNGFTKRVGFLSNPTVLDGSVVTVIPKKEKPPRDNNGKFLENFGTLAAIISSTLTTIFLVQRLD